MQFSNEEVLQPQSILSVRSERIATKWLVLAAGESPFFDAASYAVDLQQSLSNRLKRTTSVETSGIIAESVASVRKLARLIPQFDSIQLFYDGTVSFSKSIIPAVVISRFFGKGIALLYYPGQIIDEIPRTHRKVMSLCSNVYVGTRYLQRELAKRNVESEVLLPPVTVNSIPVRTISRVQPHILLVHESATDAGAICAAKAAAMVKQKYPRTELTNLTEVPQEFRKAFADADIFVNCSASESAPAALLAAMASGMPSISFETYGAREIIENGVNGFLIRHNDHNQLADSIIKLVEESALVSKVSQEATKLKDKLAVEKLVRLMLR